MFHKEHKRTGHSHFTFCIHHCPCAKCSKQEFVSQLNNPKHVKLESCFTRKVCFVRTKVLFNSVFSVISSRNSLNNSAVKNYTSGKCIRWLHDRKRDEKRHIYRALPFVTAEIRPSTILQHLIQTVSK